VSVSSTIAAGRSSHPAEKPAPAASVGQQLLTKAQSSRSVIQDFVPLAESLEWELGKAYLRERGTKAFLSDFSPVPYVINNDGTLSRNAAELFFESCQQAAVSGQLSGEEEIYVLELGIGVGLFARFFLDNFKELCRKRKKDSYDRLCYIAADNSPRMLMDLARHGLLAGHGGHYVLRQVDAMEPGKWLLGDALFQGSGDRGQGSVNQGTGDRGQGTGRRPLIRAVFLNYLLDCLPAAVLEIGGREQETGDREQEVRQLCVRTCLARNVNLADFTDISVGGGSSSRQTGTSRGGSHAAVSGVGEPRDDLHASLFDNSLLRWRWHWESGE
jgi:hypothetical protein